MAKRFNGTEIKRHLLTKVDLVFDLKERGYKDKEEVSEEIIADIAARITAVVAYGGLEEMMAVLDVSLQVHQEIVKGAAALQKERAHVH